jgi:nitroreductase
VNSVIDCLMDHRSIRRFRPEPVDDETIDTLLQAGVRAATAGNLQQYSLIVVDDPEVKSELWKGARDTGAIAVVAVIDLYRMKRWLELNDAPFYFCHVVNLLIAYWDAIIALHNIVVAAESMGLGAYYVGTILSLDLSEMLGTPEYVFPAGLAWIGHPDESPELRPRLPLEAVVHRNGYQIPSDDDIRRFYRERDAMWEQIPAERRERLEARGIHNFAQMRTVGHYTEEFIRGESEAILKHLKKAGFWLTEDPTF